MSAAAEKPKRYRIEWRICGHTDVIATSPEEARLKFDKDDLSTEEMLSAGYDDIEVFDNPEEVEIFYKAKARP